MNFKIIIPLLAAALSIGSGCVSTPLPPMDRRVTLAADLGQSIYVTDVRCTKGNSDFLTLQANVVNNSMFDRGVAWKVQWLDADGMEIDSIMSTWKEIVIKPNDIVGLKSTAPTSDAADMRIFVKSR